MRRGRSGKKAVNSAEEQMEKALDELAEYEEFKDKFLKKLRKMYQDGATADEIMKVSESIAAMRQATIAATEQDSGKALAAIKDLMDRVRGKATEKKEIHHKFDDLSDEELDAVIMSELNQEEDEKHH